MTKDIVIDNSIMVLYSNPADVALVELFKWIQAEGVLCVSNKLISEYVASQPENMTALLAHLTKFSENIRLIKISNEDISSFNDDKNFKYTCNGKDRPHAKVVFLSSRKKLISKDRPFVNDINRFRKVDKIKPEAIMVPKREFYE